ncbi:MAG: PEP-CTERM sorting domain-containing protein [Colwellia sp.]|nr:PEP-CTERM sorting domain-containing protein [Colwellia sp.]
MKFITKLSAMCAAITVIFSSMSYAGTVASTKLADNYIGANGGHSFNVDYTPNNVTANYDTHWMKVFRTLNDDGTGSLKVKIKSNFVSYNNESGYDFGDLFIMDAANYTLADACTDNKGNTAYGCNEYSVTPNGATPHAGVKESPNQWQYAFDLGDSRDRSYGKNDKQQGDLRELYQGADYKKSLITTSSDRKWQAIKVSDNVLNANVGNGGKWWTKTNKDFLIMKFDITGTSLMTAAQLALRWQMTCANDIIEVVTNFKSGKPGPIPVPEPGTLMLMLLAGVGLFAARQKKR